MCVSTDVTFLETLRAQTGCVALGAVEGHRGGLSAWLADSADDRALLERVAVCGPLVLTSFDALAAPAPLGTPKGHEGVSVLLMSGDQGRRLAVVSARGRAIVALLPKGDANEPLSKLKRAVFRQAQTLGPIGADSGVRPALRAKGDEP